VKWRLAASADTESGSVIAFTAVMAIGLLVLVGLVYDGGQIIAAHSEARSHAAKAARAGAQEIDLTELRLTGRTVLDPTAAEAAARAYLTEVGAQGTVRVDGATVTVTVTAVQPMRILPMPDRRITTSRTATAIDEEGITP
jgi:Flp pilus assembly protein TadG